MGGMRLDRRSLLAAGPIQVVVVFGNWFVNSGNEFQPQDAVPVGPGGYVKRTARTQHYDGVPADQAHPAVIAIVGLGPVDVELVDSSQPSWRQV
jgi:hypothetical protein